LRTLSNSIFGPDDVKNALVSLRSCGYFKLPLNIVEADCQAFMEYIDSALPGSESHYGDTESRIWDAEKKEKSIFNLQKQLDSCLSAIFGHAPECNTTLGIRNLALQDRNFDIGRWHVDSVRSQYKFFCFLTTVHSDNGPLMVVRGTASKWFKIKQILKGIYFSLLDFKNGTRKYTQIDDAYINKLLDNGYSSQELICSAGDIFLVNTSMLHRAKPIKRGERYALVSYYDTF
jgi:hypothetical protein